MTPPADVTWLSLIMTMSNKPILWFLPPPMSTAHLSGSLNPGAVFLVSKMRADVPCQVCMLSRHDVTGGLFPVLPYCSEGKVLAGRLQ